MAQRFYSNTSPLESAVSGYQEGQKFKNDELYRQAQLDLQKKQLLAEQGRTNAQTGQFDATQFEGKGQTERDENGNPTGRFIPNQDVIDRDKKWLHKNSPETFNTEISPATPAAIDPQQAKKDALTAQALADAKAEAARNGEAPLPSSPGAPAGQEIIPQIPSALPKMNSYIPPPGPPIPQMPQAGMQSQPAPLKPLLDPMAGKPIKPITEDKNTPLPIAKRDDTEQLVQGIDQKMSFDKDLPIKGPTKPTIETPAKPAVNEELDPSFYLQADLQKKLTSNLHPTVSTKGWPEDMRSLLGLKPGDADISIPASLAQGVIDSNIRAKYMMGLHGQDVEASDFARRLQAHEFANADETQQAFETKMGRAAYPRESALFQAAQNANLGQQKISNQENQFNKNFDFKNNKEINNALSGYVKQVASTTKDEQTALKYAEEIEKALSNPDTNGRATQVKLALGRMMSPQAVRQFEYSGLGGVTDIGGRLAQLISTNTGDGITDENINSYLSIAHEIKDVAHQSMRNKTQAFAGPALRTVMSHGYSQEAAQQAVEQVFDPESFVNYGPNSSNSGKHGQNNPAPARPRKQAQGAPAQSHAPESNPEDDKMNSALDRLESMNLDPSKKREARARLEAAYQQNTGKQWERTQ